MNTFSNLSEGGSPQFMIRWRGKQDGPFSASAIDVKLAAHEIGLLHEILQNGRWVTIRDYMAERELILQSESQAREEEEQKLRQETDRKAREVEEQNRTAALAEERRRNDLLAGLERQANTSRNQMAPQVSLKPHRGGIILALGLLGLLICGPLCLAAWIMGSGDLSEMDAGLMDPNGRSTTAVGRTLGVVGTILWVIGFIYFLAAQQ